MKILRLLAVCLALGLVLGGCAAPTAPAPPTTGVNPPLPPASPTATLTIEPAAALMTTPQESRVLTLRAANAGTPMDASQLDVEWVSSEPNQFSVTPLGNGQVRVTALTEVGSAMIVARSRDGKQLSEPFMAVAAHLKPNIELIPDSQVIFPPVSTVLNPEPDAAAITRVFSEDELAAFVGDGRNGRLVMPYILSGTFKVGDLLIASESAGLMGRVLQVIVRQGQSLVQVESTGPMPIFSDLDYGFSTQRLIDLSLMKDEAGQPLPGTAGTRLSPQAIPGMPAPPPGYAPYDCKTDGDLTLAKFNVTVNSALTGRFDTHLKVTDKVFKHFDIITGWNAWADVSASVEMAASGKVAYRCLAESLTPLIKPVPGALGALVSIAVVPKIGGKIEVSGTIGQPLKGEVGWKGWSKFYAIAEMDENFKTSFHAIGPTQDTDKKKEYVLPDAREGTGEVGVFAGADATASIEAILGGAELVALRNLLFKLHLTALAGKIGLLQKSLSFHFLDAEAAGGPNLKLVLPRSVLLSKGSSSEGQGRLDLELTALPGVFENLSNLFGKLPGDFIGFEPIKFSRLVWPHFYQPMILNNKQDNARVHPKSAVNGVDLGNVGEIKVRIGDSVDIVPDYIYNNLDNTNLPTVEVSRSERYVDHEYQQDTPYSDHRSMDAFVVDKALCERLKPGADYEYLGYNKFLRNFNVAGYGGVVRIICLSGTTIQVPNAIQIKGMTGKTTSTSFTITKTGLAPAAYKVEGDGFALINPNTATIPGSADGASVEVSYLCTSAGTHELLLQVSSDLDNYATKADIRVMTDCAPALLPANDQYLLIPDLEGGGGVGYTDATETTQICTAYSKADAFFTIAASLDKQGSADVTDDQGRHRVKLEPLDVKIGPHTGDTCDAERKALVDDWVVRVKAQARQLYSSRLIPGYSISGDLRQPVGSGGSAYYLDVVPIP